MTHGNMLLASSGAYDFSTESTMPSFVAYDKEEPSHTIFSKSEWKMGQLKKFLDWIDASNRSLTDTLLFEWVGGEKSFEDHFWKYQQSNITRKAMSIRNGWKIRPKSLPAYVCSTDSDDKVEHGSFNYFQSLTN